MKKYLSILAFSCLTLCSCDNFLDLTPQSVLTPENAYEKPEDWQQTLYAAYGSLQEVFVGKYSITLTEFGTDEVIPFDMGWGGLFRVTLLYILLLHTDSWIITTGSAMKASNAVMQ